MAEETLEGAAAFVDVNRRVHGGTTFLVGDIVSTKMNQSFGEILSFSGPNAKIRWDSIELKGDKEKYVPIHRLVLSEGRGSRHRKRAQVDDGPCSKQGANKKTKHS